MQDKVFASNLLQYVVSS